MTNDESERLKRNELINNMLRLSELIDQANARPVIYHVPDGPCCPVARVRLRKVSNAEEKP